MKKGFTLVEVLVTTAILGGVVSAILYTVVQCFSLQETNKNLTIAMNVARAEIEKLRNQDFSSITTGSFTFDPAGLDGKGQVEISDAALSGGGTTTDLKDIRVAICWRQMGGRIVGEDNGSGAGGIALDGVLNGAEDADSDSEIDSPCVIYTAIANKGL